MPSCAGADERTAAGHHPRRRLRAGRVVAVGGSCGGGRAGERILDVCAAPGGKATAIAGGGARVIAADSASGRVRLVQENAGALGLDARRRGGCRWYGAAVPARVVRRGAARRAVLGLGRAAPARRRPLADHADRHHRAGRAPGTAARRQRSSSHPEGASCTACAPSRRPSRSTTTVPPASRSTIAPPTVGQWRPFEQGWRVLPQDADTDAMVLIRYRRSRELSRTDLPRRPRSQGAHRQRRRGPRHTRRPQRSSTGGASEQRLRGRRSPP
jgi:hypothetical protein